MIKRTLKVAMFIMAMPVLVLASVVLMVLVSLSSIFVVGLIVHDVIESHHS